MIKRTKIVCTIGPASEQPATLEKMIRAGLNVARLNFSHNTYDHHALLLRRIRAASKKVGQPIAIIQDLQGPRIRIGKLDEQGIAIKKGQTVALIPERGKYTVEKSATPIPIQYAGLYNDVKVGHTVLIEDGLISLQVKKVSGKVVYCTVVSGALIRSHKGMNFPETSISAPALTAKDKKDVLFGVEHDVDFVALSFVKNARDIVRLRTIITQAEGQYKKKNLGTTKIIAKIERPEALENFEEILTAADGIMIARGDLGLETPIHDVPLLQKDIIRRCIQEAKPVIVATQMLESMTRNPVPTRAEVSDVANAILDGTDAIMLSGESAAGDYPVQAVDIMKDVANSVEPEEMNIYQMLEEHLKLESETTEAVSFAVQDIAEDVQASLIVCCTTSGYTARSIAKFRSHIPVIAITPSHKTLRQLQLSWGVTAYYEPLAKDLDSLMVVIRKLLIKEKLVKKGDKVVIAASHPFGKVHETNLIKVEIV